MSKIKKELLQQGHGPGRGVGARVGTGRPHTGGRVKGVSKVKGPKNLTERKEAIASQIELAEYTGLTPLEFMLNTMRNGKLDITTRLQAARDAAPYVHAKLQSIMIKGNPNEPVSTVSLTPAQYRDIVTKALQTI